MGKIKIIKDNLPKIAVIGDGSWATAIVKILSENPVRVKWWVRNREDVRYIKKFGHNPNYLPSAKIKKRRLRPVSNIKRAVRDVDIIILAIPATYLKKSVEKLLPADFQGKKVVSAIKGMMPDENQLVTDWVQDRFKVSTADLAIICGPCHAEEVAMERQSFITLSSDNKTLSNRMAELMACRFVKTSTVGDLKGVEYSAVMKNIVAIACGICHGLNMGDNFQAVLVSNAIQEIRRFLDAADPLDRDVNASAYLGDLLVTAYSQFSRNRTLGSMVGRGYSVKSAVFEMRMVAEGYYAVESIYEINKKLKVDMPICTAVYNILYEKISPRIELQLLINQLR